MIDIAQQNEALNGKSPKEIIEWAINYAKNAVVTTNFRPYEAAILHACAGVKADISVVWCDTGYNTSYTYRHADRVIKALDLNVKLPTTN